jgi:hypothetical protein
VGLDEKCVARHAHKRGTYTQGEPYKGNVEGSDPKCSCSLVLDPPERLLHRIRGAGRTILSFNTLNKNGSKGRHLTQLVTPGRCLEHSPCFVQTGLQSSL